MSLHTLQIHIFIFIKNVITFNNEISVGMSSEVNFFDLSEK